MTTAGTVPDEQPDEHASHEHDTPSYDDINTPVVVLVGVISALITLLTILFVQGMCYHWQNSFVKERTTDAANLPANIQIAEQRKILKGDKGIVSIEDSMKKIVDQYGKQ